MKPTGAARPAAYFIGEAPGADEDRKGEQFVGSAGRLLRRRVPARWLGKIRFNNVVRTQPPKNRAPVWVEVEACRPSIVRDIVESQPSAIVGFGNIPLEWATGETSITKWTGRRIPVTVGGKAYWFFPIIHPTTVQRDPKWRGAQERSDRYGSETEFQFALHIRQALEAIERGLPEPIVHTAEEALSGVECVTGAGGARDVARVRSYLEAAAARKITGLDYETNAIRPYAAGAKILTAAVSTAADGTLAFALDHREAQWSPQQRREIDRALQDFLYEPSCRKVAHNLAFELEWSAYFYGEDCVWSGRWGDSIAQAYVLDERRGAHSLEFLCVQYFGINIKKLSTVNRDNLDAEPLLKVLQYNGPDAKYHRLLYAAQMRALKEAGLSRLYAEHLARVPVAVLTQLKGVPVSQERVLALGQKYIPRMMEAQARLHELAAVKKFERAAGARFRPSANDDIMRVCNSLGYHPDNVDEAALEGLDHEFARRVIEWRKATKVYGTYVMPTAAEATRVRLEQMRRSGLQKILGPTAEFKEISSSRIYSDGMGHPQTNVNRTRTSRTSADDWNYQNWPKRGAADAIEVRGIVEPRSDELIVSFDYGQIQARNVGQESLDRALLDAFWSGYDIHAAFMEHLARIYPPWVKEGVKALARDDDAGEKLRKKYRNDVKHGFVFASFFGAQPKKFVEVLGIPMRPAEMLAEIFWDQFGGIRRWHRKLEVDYYRTGYVTGHSGYRRRAPVSYNERINSPIQADEAKIVLDAMIRLSKIDHDLLQASMEIHDDLTFIWPKKKVDELADIVIREMLTVPFEWARVTPIVVEMSVGRNWAELQAPAKMGFARYGGGEFSSHKYVGVDMPKKCPIVGKA